MPGFLTDKRVKSAEIRRDLEALDAQVGAWDVSPDTLDWYEEGTFDPGISFGGATTGILYDTQIGTFTRIGNYVHFAAQIILSDMGTDTGTALMTGLPYEASPENDYPVSLRFSMAGGNWGEFYAAADVVGGSSTIRFWQMDPSAPDPVAVQVNEADFTSDTELYVGGGYATEPG